VCVCVCVCVCACVRACMCDRVSYIFCDPVLACITVIPVLLLHRLPILVEEFLCLDPSQRDNSSCVNHSSVAPASRDGLRYAGNLTTQQKLSMQNTVVSIGLMLPRFTAIWTIKIALTWKKDHIFMIIISKQCL